MKPVLVVGPIPPPVHGASRVTAQVVKQLRARGTVVRVVRTEPSTHRFGYHLYRLLAHVKAAMRLFSPSRPILYVAGAGGLGLWYQVGLLHLARVLQRERYFHHHSYAYLTQRSSAMGWLVRADPVHVALSQEMGRVFERLYSPTSEVLVQSNAAFIDLPAFSPSEAGAGGLRLVHVSNLSFEKGLARVLRAFGALSAATGGRCALTLVGPCSGRDEQRAIDSWKGPSFRYLGPLAPADVQTVLLEQDVFVFPSTNEAEPLVVLESLSCGLRVIASPVGCLPEWLHEPMGVCVRDDEELLEELIRLASSPPTQEHREAVRAAFAKEHAASPLLQALTTGAGPVGPEHPSMPPSPQH